MFGIIYCIENTINGHKYIGQTARTLEERVAEHYKFSKYEYSQGRALYQAINKYGKENFIAYEVDVANTQEELDEKETYWIEKFNTYLGRGYNMSPGGQLERKNHANQEISNKLSETFGGREFLVYDMEGNFIKSVVSQTAFAKEIGCAIQSVNNCLKGIKSQVKGYILIYKDEFSNEELNKRINSRRKFHEFVIFDENDNFVGQWESERSCNMDTGIDLGYIHNCLINNNSHKRKTKQKSVYKCFYLENCPEYLLNKKEEYTDGTNK